MQGFNKYYPPDYDPSKGSLNALHGKHALGDRARKLDQGILIVRFELPFNIWCLKCNNHIGMGVRYNAEKKKIGSYYSTPIFSFRCKCHLCDNWFTIETDPKNTRYVVTSGAKQKAEDWDPAENGGFAIRDSDAEAQKPADAFSALEKTQIDRTSALSRSERLNALEELQSSRWADPYALSCKLRSNFRKEKKERVQSRDEWKGLSDKYALGDRIRGDIGEEWEREADGLDDRWLGDVKVDGIGKGKARLLAGDEDDEVAKREARRERKAKLKQEEDAEWKRALEMKEELQKEKEEQRRKLKAEIAWSDGNTGSNKRRRVDDDGRTRPRPPSSTLGRYTSNRHSLPSRLPPSSVAPPSHRRNPKMTTQTLKPQLASLRSRILQNTKLKSDPFLKPLKDPSLAGSLLRASSEHPRKRTLSDPQSTGRSATSPGISIRKSG